MASISHIEKVANNYTHESFEMSTLDHDDHSFSGIMFDICVTSKDMPVDCYQLEEVSVRGGLGQITIWMTEQSWKGKHNRKSKWKLLYKKFHEASYQTLQALKLDEPLILKHGESFGLYIHSEAQNDDSIVYDNQRRETTYEDDLITIFPGIAHLDCNAFGESAPWGGSAWRQGRSFVGRISYGVRYQLWTPEVTHRFPLQFRQASSAFCNVHAFAWKGLPLDIIKYILNMCSPSWFDCPAAMVEKNKRRLKDTEQAGTLYSSIIGNRSWDEAAEKLATNQYFRRCCVIL
jgi:hypothetical protein